MANAGMNGHDDRNMGGLYQRAYDLANWLEFYLKHLQLIRTTADERTCGVDVNAYTVAMNLPWRSSRLHKPGEPRDGPSSKTACRSRAVTLELRFSPHAVLGCWGHCKYGHILTHTLVLIHINSPCIFLRSNHQQSCLAFPGVEPRAQHCYSRSRTGSVWGTPAATSADGMRRLSQSLTTTGQLLRTVLSLQTHHYINYV